MRDHYASHSVLIIMEGESHSPYTKSLLHVIRACVYVNSSLQASSITGNTLLSKGDTLYLDCDTSNSRPSPRVEWLSPEGVVVSNERILKMTNIQESALGKYTCVATHPLFGAIVTVNVTVQYECQVKNIETSYKYMQNS